MGMILSFDVRGSMLTYGTAKEIVELSADSLQMMIDAVKFEIVHNDAINSLVFSKDGKYYLSTLIINLCINYDLNVIN